MKTNLSSTIPVTILLAILIIACPTSLHAQTIVPPGFVSGVWDTAHSPYLVQGDISIPDDSTLTIDPGVLVEFQGHYMLDVKGRLLAVGTHEDTITFTVNDTTGFHDADTILGGWYGIRMIDVPLHNDTTRIDYCRIEYGKAVEGDWFLNAGGGMCILHFDKVVISNSVFTNCSAGGPNEAVGGAIAAAWSDIRISNTVFSHNRADGGGAIHFYESDPVMTGNRFEENRAANGGALDLQTKSHVTLRHNVFTGNVAAENGGAIRTGGDSVIVNFDGDVLTGNIAQTGGAIHATFSELILGGCTISSNRAEFFGGGVNAYMASLTLFDCDLEEDTSNHDGGALSITESDCRIDNSDFRNNRAVDDGGALSSAAGVMHIENSLFRGNLSVWGGVLYMDGSDIDIVHSEFIDDSAEHGGVICGGTSSLSLRNSVFQSNRGIWGGVMSTTNVTMDIDSCTFSGNTAQVEGGAFEYWADTTGFTLPYSLTMKNSTFEENRSAGRSGVMLIEQTGSTDMLIDLTIDRCDFTGNTADRVGVSRIAGMPDFSITNSRFIGNTGTSRTAGLALATPDGNLSNCLFLDHRNSLGPTFGVGMLASSHAAFVNCTFVNRADSGANGISMRQGASVSAVNSIFRGEGQKQFSLVAVTDTTPCHLYLEYCDVQYGMDSITANNPLSVVHWGAGNMDDDPKFIDPAGGDFRLQESSPCVAAGTDSVQIAGMWHFAPAADLDGTPRPTPPGTMPDMGAYESLSPITEMTEDQLLPAAYALHQNYPNPFNPVTTIPYDLPRASRVSLRLYDILGRQISTLVDAYQTGGVKLVELDGRDLPSGVYLYTLRAGDFFMAKKLMLLR